MQETPDDLRGLQEVLDRSRERAGPHLRSIFEARYAFSARELADFFTGPRQIAVATVTGAGEPRVAPVDAILLRGRFWFGTHESAARVRHLRVRPATSLVYFERDVLAIVVRGVAELIRFGDPEFTSLDEHFLDVYGGMPSTESERSVYVGVEPRTMYTFARDEELLREGRGS